MLNENTRKGLKSLTTIGNTAILRYPLTSVLQKNKSLIAFIDLEELGEEAFEEFGMETMSEFLSLVDFYDNPEISLDNSIINIEAGKYHQRYRTSPLDTMKSFDVKLKTLQNVEGTPQIIEFDITKDDFSRFKKIASLVKATEFIVDARSEGNERIIVGKLDKMMNVSDDSVTDYVMSANKEIGIVYDMSDIVKLPDNDYNVKIMQSATSGNCISLWEIANEPIKIVVAVQDIIEA